jgi:hypothetical protein
LYKGPLPSSIIAPQERGKEAASSLPEPLPFSISLITDSKKMQLLSANLFDYYLQVGRK